MLECTKLRTICIDICAQRQVGDEQQNAKPGGGTMGRSSVIGIVNNQGDGVMSEMARRLQERRAKTDHAPEANVCTCFVSCSAVLW